MQCLVGALWKFGWLISVTLGLVVAAMFLTNHPWTGSSL